MRSERFGRAALALLLGWAAQGASCAETEPAAAAPSGIQVRLHLEDADGRATERFAADEPVVLVLTVRNPGDRAWQLPLSSAQSHDFAIEARDGRELWRWSAARRFAQRLGELRLGPGEERRFRATWSPERTDALPAGRYRAAGWIGVGRSRGPIAELDFRVATRG